LDPRILAISGTTVAPIGWAALGALIGIAFWLLARRQAAWAVPCRFLGAVAATWVALCLAYLASRPEDTFPTYLVSSFLATEVIAAVGFVFYARGWLRLNGGRRRWRESSSVVAGVALMGSAFVRAAYQPAVALPVEAPLAVVFVATVWRLRAEPLVYLAILGVAITVVLGARDYVAGGAGAPATEWVTSTGAAVSLVMVVIGSLLGLARPQEANIRWYRQGLMIVPLVVSSLAALGAGYVAVWHGTSWHTVWALGTWWAVLLAASLVLKQADLFGFSCVGAGLTAVAAFAVTGADQAAGYWGRYPSIILAIALGSSLLAAGLVILRLLRRQPSSAFPRALYLAGAVLAMAALVIEPLGTTSRYLGLDLLVAAAVLTLAHAHRAPTWVNYLVAALATGGIASLAHMGPGVAPAAWHHRFIQVMAGSSVLWLVVALAVREVLRRAASDRMARRQAQAFAIVGMGVVLVLAAYLWVQEVRVYSYYLLDGEGDCPTLALLGPFWGLVGWVAVLVAFLLSMWLVRHTARTFLFYCFGIMSVVYLGLFQSTHDLYGYLIYAVAGYGASHLVVYLYEAKFMALLSRTCALYREERRASTTIFTLAVISCFTGAFLAVFRLSGSESLVMLGIMAVVFLGWSFVWLRGEMLYPAVFMATLAILSIWHNKVSPMPWNEYRLATNAMVMGVSAIVWMGIGNRLHAIRGEIFQLAAPARSCSAILGFVGFLFAGALAIAPTFGTEVWRQQRTLSDWALGLLAHSSLILYFAWAGIVFNRRLYSLLSVLAVALLALYVGMYVGVRLSGGGAIF
jgi:hypothetical protein